MRRIDRAKDEQIITKEIYMFIQKYVNQHGKVPLYKEIAEDVGVSRSTVDRHMLALKDCGLLVEVNKGKARGYRLATTQEIRRIQ